MRTGQNCELKVNGELMELTAFGTPMFPCAAWDERFSRFVGGVVPWHWHEEMEIIYVMEGNMQVRCGEKEYVIRAGEALFINGNVLHRCVSAPGETDCHIHSFVFKAELAAGAPQGTVQQRYLTPLMRTQALASLPLSRDGGWRQAAIDSFSAAFAAFESDAFGAEMLVQAELTRFLYALVRNESALIEDRTETLDRDAARIKAMLAFIHGHYGDPLTVGDIAGAANLSQSECYRCFAKVLKSTPADYLLQFRTRMAAALLAGTDRDVSDVCFSVGFNSPSYFAKMFRRQLHQTPREYRASQRRLNAALAGE